MADQNQYGFFRDVLLNDGALVVSGITTGGDAENGIASGGTTGQILAKVDDTNYNTEWVNYIPTGGTTGQVLSKVDDTNYNTQWTTTQGLPSFLEYNSTNRTFWNNGRGNKQTNTFFGENIYNNGTYGDWMTAFGYNTFSVTLGNTLCSAFGSQALEALTNGNSNTAIGSFVLNATTTGVNNTGIGVDTLLRNTTGGSNTGMGVNTLRNSTTGQENVAVGNAALINNTTGNGNTAIGYLSGLGNTTGANNVAIGYETSTGNRSSCIILGREATPTANNQFVVGSTNYNAGAVATESLTSTRTWSVVINGVARKILLA
jgi:hypothetical protein